MIAAFEKTIRIAAAPAEVWKTLTVPDCMLQWMGERDLQLQVHTTWEVNSPFVISGFHHIKFENRGKVLQFEPEQLLVYTHRSTVSRLPDTPESDTVFTFQLQPAEGGTTLTLRIENFPTETIYKHLAFYWPVTLEELKAYAETRV